MVVDKISEIVKIAVKNLGLPEVPAGISNSEFDLDLSNAVVATDDVLSEMLLFYGGWKAFLDAQLAELEAERTILSETFQEALFKGYHKIHKEYSSRMEKPPVKDAVRGEILATNPVLNKVKKDLIITDAKIIQLKGARESYKTLYDTVSRVVALRLRGKFDE